MNITNDTSVESSLVDQHKAFKDNAVRVLHEVGVQRGWCFEFDRILVDAGLPGRDSFHDDLYADDCSDRPALVGEETVEDFETWKREVARKLHDAARRHDIGARPVDDVMAQIGLPTSDAFYRTVNLKVEGTFSLSLGSREVAVGADIVDGVSRYDISQALYNGVHNDDGDVLWKVVVED